MPELSEKTDISAGSVSAGSIFKSKPCLQVSYTNDETSQLARQAFLESLVTNASHVFQDTNFAASYGQPQVFSLPATKGPHIAGFQLSEKYAKRDSMLAVSCPQTHKSK